MTYRVAILGAGIGAQHLDGYRANADAFRVTCLCDLDLERARGVAGDGIRVCGDMDEVLGDPEVDLIDICLPPHLHVPVALQALTAGKDVICEKPLACSLTECDQLAEAVAQSGRSLFPVFQYRYGRAMDQLRALMQAGLTGKAYAATFETHWNRGRDYYAIPWRGTWAGEQGGAILGHAIHAHDLMTHLLGPVAQVSGSLATRVNPIETEDCAALSFVMQSGALVTSSVTLGGAEDRSRIVLLFEGLTAQSGASPYAPMSDCWQFRARDPAYQGEVDAICGAVPEVRNGFDGFLQAVGATLRGEAERAINLQDGRGSIELVSAIYAAHRRGSAVSLPLAKDDPAYAGWREQAKG